MPKKIGHLAFQAGVFGWNFEELEGVLYPAFILEKCSILTPTSFPFQGKEQENRSTIHKPRTIPNPPPQKKEDKNIQYYLEDHPRSSGPPSSGGASKRER